MKPAIVIFLFLLPSFVVSENCQIRGVSPPIPITTAADLRDRHSAVVVNPETGDYLVVWLSFNPDGGPQWIFGRLLDWQGRRISPLLIFDKGNAYRNQKDLDDNWQNILIAYNSREKEYLVAWMVRGLNNTHPAIRAQRVSGQGEKRGPILLVDRRQDPGILKTQEMVYNSFLNEYAILYSSAGETTRFFTLRRLDKSGLPIGAPVQTHSRYISHMELAYDEVLHRYMIAWHSFEAHGFLYRLYTSRLGRLTENRVPNSWPHFSLIFNTFTRQYVFFSESKQHTITARFVNEDGAPGSFQTVPDATGFDPVAQNGNTGELLFLSGWRLLLFKANLKLLNDNIQWTCAPDMEISPEQVTYNPVSDEYLLIYLTGDNNYPDIFAVRIRL